MIINEPTECPSCSAKLHKINSQLFCRSPSCSAQLQGKLVHFTKTLGIKGLGPKSIENLGLESVMDIYYLPRSIYEEVLGVKTATKILEEIDKSRSAQLSVIIEAMAIPLIGAVASKKIASVISDLSEITEEACKSAGLGDKATESLMNWVELEYPDIRDILPFVPSSETINTEDYKTVCITGKLRAYKNKSAAQNDLKAAGYILVDSVTKDLDYLIDESGDTNSSKHVKAVKYSIPIVTDINYLLNLKS